MFRRSYLMDRYSLVSEKRWSRLMNSSGHQNSFRPFLFDGNLVITGFLVAVMNESFLLRGFLQQVWRTALRTLLLDRFVPGHEIACGIFHAPVESLPTFGAPLAQLAAAARLWTGNADQIGFNVFALWIIAARSKCAVASVFHHEF